MPIAIIIRGPFRHLPLNGANRVGSNWNRIWNREEFLPGTAAPISASSGEKLQEK
jgi:hypothetical protein